MANGHGGARPGSGRPSGVNWKNQTKSVLEVRKQGRMKLAEVIGSPGDPLTFLCDLAASAETDIGIRLAAAIAAVPFLHPKLSAQSIAVAKVDARDPQALLDKLQAALRAPSISSEPATIEAEAEPVAA